MGKLLGLKVGMRHERVVAEWCEEAIEALSMLTGRGNVVPLDEGKCDTGG
jgi:hypothetical protein